MTDQPAPAAGAPEDLLTEIRDGIAFVTFNRPAARNAISTEMIHRLLDFLGKIESDRDVRVLLLQATGKSFIAGGDVRAFGEGLKMSAEDRAEDMRARAARAGRLSEAFTRIPQPVIVAARGYAVGVGFSILCASDLTILSDTAQLIMAHVNLGISPDGAATFFLPRQVGLKRAKQIALLGDPISAQDAVAMGLANWVVPDAELDERAEQLARRLANGAASAMTEIKGLFDTSFDRDIAAQIAAETGSLSKCALTADYAEGLSAVLEKRKPVFGR